MGLKAVVQTPGVPGEEPDLEEVELPPQEMWGALMEGTAASAAENATAAPAPAPVKPEVAILEFIGNKKIVPLGWPFTLDGTLVDSVTIRRLTLGEVQEIIARPTGQKLLMFDLYAIMTGLPAPVLRGMDDDDARTVTEAAYDFLPRSLRTDDA